MWDGAGHQRRGAEVVTRMISTLVHRGPDAWGVWTDPGSPVVLGHRRLAILDLSEEGAQPMISPSGRFVVAYNGEAYNHLDLRRELPETPWRGHSDTETILAGFERWGIRATIERLVGMFAIAVWDRQARTLTLVRDRLGIKPLYYAMHDGRVLFGSELKALRAVPGFDPSVRRDVLRAYFRYNCVPQPHTIYAGTFQVPPGAFITFTSPTTPTQTTYWSAAEVARRGIESPLAGPDPELIDRLEDLLSDAVRIRTLADVPVGAFLSGGVDSSTVVALMQASSSRPVRTFSIGFEQPEYDEAQAARAVAEHLGTDHTELRVTAREAMSVIPSLATLYDEPFADSSQIPVLLVSQLARRHVTVSLSGDGGDELFAGYNRHLWGPKVWNASRRVPLLLRRAAARAILAPPPGMWQSAFSSVARLRGGRLAHRVPHQKLLKLAGLLPAASTHDLYRRLRSHWLEPLVLTDAPEVPLPDDPGFGTFMERMMLQDLVTYLPDDILTKVDRASMAVSLEARVPLLDHRVVEHAWRMPSHVKLRDGVSKWALRQVLYRHVPPALIERPKMGFGVPMGEWLRGPLREWAEALLDPSAVRQQGFLDAGVVQRAWRQHLQGRKDLQHQLWDVLMFQAWLEAQRASGSAADLTSMVQRDHELPLVQ